MYFNMKSACGISQRASRALLIKSSRLMNKSHLPLLATGILLPVCAIAQDKPNIIVFLVDDMGLMDTSVPFDTDKEGNPVVHPLNQWYHTPSMERLAGQGVRFSTFYAQSVSSPSRASLMTGQNAARHRTTNWINSESNNRTTYGPHDWNWEGLDSDGKAFPRLLREAGYRTIHVGKAHFGCIGSEGEDPLNIGFDVNIGGNSIGQPGSYYGEWGYGWIQGNRSRAVPGLEKYHGSNMFLTDALTQEAIAEMEKSVAEGRPFYLNMSHYAVHAPFEADKRFIDRYMDSGKGKQAEAFATLIEGMDKSLGDLLDRLEELGIAENTLVIFLGDNGGDAPLGGPADHGSSAPFRGRKGSEYEGGVRVPCIVAWAKPDEGNRFQKEYPVRQGYVQTQMGTIMDIYPTVLSVAGVGLPSDVVLDGSDLKRMLGGRKDIRHRRDFLMHFPHGEHRANYFTTYRKGPWKLIYFYNPETPESPSWMLYNLKKDPYETMDLSSEKSGRTRRMIKAMKRRLDTERALYPVDDAGNELKPVDSQVILLPEVLRSE